MRKVLALIALIILPTQTASATAEPLTVMTRNLYLGADVGVALELIPDFSAAAQFMWDQVSATDFTKRAPVLAQEIIKSDADVVGLKEATHWYCKKNLWSKKVVVYDFTKQFLAATKDAGSEYVLASHDGVDALNIGYSIPAIPMVTMVEDPETFQPLFGTDRAACGFEIGDAIIVKKSLAKNVKLVGNSEYETSYTIVPTLMNIYRGYTWIDIEYQGSLTRIVSTHLESLWDEGKVPHSALQAEQLIDDLQQTAMPLIVMGDFNSDPRDPRENATQNPGGQPEAIERCSKQVARPDLESARDSCNAYWKMRKAGYKDAGPSALDPTHFTWGMSALLGGPDIARYKAGKEMGNQYGFTDRLDYIFVKNGAKVVSSTIVGNTWPQGSTWACFSDEQVTNSLKLVEKMGIEPAKTTLCNDTDHAGVVADIALDANSTSSPALNPHTPFPISFWNWVGIALLLAAAYFIKRALRRRVVK